MEKDLHVIAKWILINFKLDMNGQVVAGETLGEIVDTNVVYKHHVNKRGDQEQQQKHMA